MRANATAITIQESKRLIELEKIIGKGKETFVEVGLALAEIRDLRLYKVDHKTFEDYCRKKWGWKRAYCNHVMRAAEAVKALPEKTATIVATEGQARELTKVKPDKRVEVVEKAKAKADQEERPMTAKDIREAAEPEPAPQPTRQDKEAAEQLKRMKLPDLQGHLESFKTSLLLLVREIPKEADFGIYIGEMHKALALLSNRQRDQRLAYA